MRDQVEHLALAVGQLVLGTGLVAIGLGWAGLIVLKTRDEVWDRL